MNRCALTLIGIAGIVSGCRDSEPPDHLRIAGSDAGRGRKIVAQTGCGTCHAIPSVRGARGRVGPSLDGFGARTFIAGRFPNRPGLLIRFVRNAPSLVPQTAMPKLPLDEGEARDVASFLYTLR